jgi:hypothetical protein
VFFFSDNNTNVQRLLEILWTHVARLASCFSTFQFLEIATFAPTSPLFSYGYSSATTMAPCAMSLILAANKESMAIDPINWETFTDQIQTWAQNWTQGLFTMSHFTDARFRERTHPQHSPRALSNQPLNVNLRSISSLHFYDAFASGTPATLHSIPFRAAELLRKLNRHPRFLSVLGILPNQLRTLLKESGHENREVVLLDLSRTLFFAGFRVWTKRHHLNSCYWNHIAPDNRKVQTHLKSTVVNSAPMN